MSRPINIAVLSTAHIHTKGFLEAIKNGTDGRVAYAIWDDVPDRGQRYAKDFGSTFVPDLGAVLKDPAVDGFLIAAENTRHLPLLEKALPTGKPVFCEKPLCTSTKELATVRELVQKHGSTLFCGYFQPFGGVMRAIAAKIQAGDFGQITHVRFRNAHHAAYGRWFDNPDLQWFTDPALAGGGAFMDMGTHAVHLLRSLFGPATEVWATIGNRCGAYPRVDDFGIAQITFASGVLGTVEAGWIHQGGPGGLEIQGSKGAVWDVPGKGYHFGKPGSEAQPVQALDEAPKTVDRLVAAIQKKLSAAELKADLEACMDSVAIMEAAYQASQGGSWVKVAGGSAAKAK
ncbi:MAG TPA: Gfo/Idh/MocA family oxidoreductase [Planctomycetota bacterium]|nr:Gfo/Idh/MocA family oxidoreductase [Planctomycetota bacterium]